MNRHGSPGESGELRPVKKLVLYALLWTPLLMISAVVLYLGVLTNVPQLLYMDSIRNLPFECLDFVSDDYVYRAKPGPCVLQNIEYDTVLTHGADGFRESRPASHYDVAVIGDSHAHGVGVGDHQTFAYILSSAYPHRVKNLAIGSFATRRELEVLSIYGRDVDYVVLQYCENDANENNASRKLSRESLRLQIESGMQDIMASYDEGKAMGYRKPLRDLAIMLLDGAYSSKAVWRKDLLARNMEQEASDFANVLAQYRTVLEGKRSIIVESSGWLANAPSFKATFAAELENLGWLQSRVLDSTAIFDDGDAFFLDDHINASGHRKLAAAIASEIAGWERIDPILDLRAAK